MHFADRCTPVKTVNSAKNWFLQALQLQEALTRPCSSPIEISMPDATISSARSLSVLRVKRETAAWELFCYNNLELVLCVSTQAAAMSGQKLIKISRYSFQSKHRDSVPSQGLWGVLEGRRQSDARWSPVALDGILTKHWAEYHNSNMFN